MSDGLENIENFFQGSLSENEKTAFEQAISTDPVFAGEVAWYIVSTGTILQNNLAARKELLRRFFKEYKNQADGPGSTGAQVFSLWKYVASAAAVLLLVMAIWIFQAEPSPEQMANKFIHSELADLGVAMGTARDSLETARQLINNADYDQALAILNSILILQPGNAKAREYAGIAALLRNDYSLALVHFRKLSETAGVYSNPGQFYTALTLIKRNQPGDMDQAKYTLQTVVTNKAGHYETAEAWLQDW